MTLLSMQKSSRPCRECWKMRVILALLAFASAAPAIEKASAQTLDSAAAGRVERRLAARQGRLQLPLPGTPDTDRPLTRLAAAGVSLGAPVLIRIFKAESELEVWLKKDDAFIHFATYPVCYWSGMLGPKLREGDRQSPEGFYTISTEQLHYGDRWRRALNIGYPNVFDQANGRSGSAILIHGGCDSIGCYAMTEAVKSELYDLVSSALRSGQHQVPVEVFPFRMTDANMAAHPNAAWQEFWEDLKKGYESFERTHLPPRVSVCAKRYSVADASPDDASDGEPVALCAPDAAVARAEAHAAATAILTPASAKGPQEEAGKPKLQRGSAVARTCSMARPSCRRWAALRKRRLAGLAGSNVVAHVKRPRKLH
jgi:murein L,D-transpeptidase YafK